MRRLLSQQFALIVVFLWAQGWSFAQEPTTPPASSPGDIATYYPQQDNIVRWYAVEDMKTGQKLDNMSFADIGTVSLDDGRTLHLIENRHAMGVNLDYQEITAEHVLLHRLVLNSVAGGTSSPRPPNTLLDGFFSPPLSILRAPLEVGRVWTTSVKLGPVTNEYQYKVESRVTFSLLGEDYRDCIQVVRIGDKTLDYKTTYCRQLGIAVMEILTPAGNWMRASLFAITPARLTLTGLRATPGGCEHVFEHAGFSPDEDLDIVVVDTTLPRSVEPVKLQRRASERIHIGLNPKANQGRWFIEVKGTRSKAFAYYVVNWTGACRANFLAPPPSLKPSLSLLAQEADAETQIKYIMMGSGWRVGESLSFAQVGPGSDVPPVSMTKADKFGVSGVIVSTLNLPAKGVHTFTLKGEASTATLTVECQEDRLCFTKSATPALGGVSEGKAAYQRPDPATALNELKAAAEHGDSKAQFSLGAMYSTGTGVEQDHAEALRWIRKAADQGHAKAQFALGEMYGHGKGMKQDYAEALKWYRRAADQGDIEAQNNLGAMYRRGEGVKQDYSAALKWFRKAAEQGDALAQHSLGLMYDLGEGVEKDHVAAVEWYRKAADQGLAQAQNALGVMYREGQGVVEKDYAEALKRYRKAADQGYALSQFNLGVMYFNGESVDRNYAEALKWFRKAAEQGNADAQFNIGQIYKHGLGVKQDTAEAITWFRKAAAQGHAAAIAVLR